MMMRKKVNTDEQVKSLPDVIKREYRIIFSDKIIVAAFFGAAILLPFFYAYIYKNEVIREVPIAVVNLDNNNLSRKLIRLIDATEHVKVKLKLNNLAQAKAKFLRGDVMGVLLIPKDFSKKVMAKETANIAAYYDVSYFLYYKQVMKGINYGAMYFSVQLQVNSFMLKGTPLNKALTKAMPLKLVTNTLYNPSQGYSAFLMPTVLLLALQQCLLLAIGMINGLSREEGKYLVLRPLAQKTGGILTIICGKTFAYLSFFLIFAYFIIFLFFLLNGYPQRGNLFDLFMFLLPFFVCVIFFAFILSSFFTNRENSMMLLLFSGIPCLFLTGISWPITAMPTWLQYLRLLVPSSEGVDGFIRITQMGATLPEVMGQWTVLWGLCGFYLLISALLWKVFLTK